MADTPKWDDTEEVTTPSFDDTTPPTWDDTQEAPASGPSMLESASRGAGQGLTFGFADELGGAVQAGMDKVIGFFGESPSEVNARLAAEGFTGDIGPTSSTDTYVDARDQNRDIDKAAEAANPYSYKGSELFGNILSGAGTGGMGAKALGTGAKALAGIAAVEGALQGAGMSEGDTFGEVAADTGLGFGLGGVLGAAAPKVLGAAGKLASKSVPTAAGATIGGITGYNSTEDDASAIDKLKSMLAGAGIGAAAGSAGHALGKGASKLLGLEDLGGDLKTARELGKRGLSLFKDADKQTILNESEQVVAEVASKLQKNLDNVKIKSDKAADALKTTEKSLLEAQEKAAVAATQQEKRAAAREVEAASKEIIGKLDSAKKLAGEGIAASYDSLEQAGMQYNPTNVVDSIMTPLSDMQARSTGTGQEAFIQSAMDQIQNAFDNGVPGDVNTARRLKNTISELINSAPDARTAKILSDGYRSLNEDLVRQASEQGLSEIADKLTTSNSQYYRASLLDNTLGKRFQKGVQVDPRLVKTSQMLQGSAQAQNRAGGNLVLDKAQQELAALTDGATDALIERGRNAGNVAASLKAPTKAQIADQIQPQLLEAEQQLLKEAAPTVVETAAQDVEKLVGKQTQLSDKVSPSSGLRNWSKSLTNPKEGSAGEVSSRLKTMLGDDFAPSIDKVRKAQQASDVVTGAKQKDVTSTSSNIVSQVFAMLGGVGQGLATRGANLVGSAERSVAQALDSATPEALKQTAAFINDLAPEAARRMTTAAETTDPMKRRALMFLVTQDPSFKKAMQNEEGDQDKVQELNMEGTVVTAE